MKGWGWSGGRRQRGVRDDEACLQLNSVYDAANGLVMLCFRRVLLVLQSVLLRDSRVLLSIQFLRHPNLCVEQDQDQGNHSHILPARHDVIENDSYMRAISY